MRKSLIFLLMMFVLQMVHGRTSFLFDNVLQNNKYQEIIYAREDVVYLLPGQRYVASYNIHLPQIIFFGEITIELIEKPDYLIMPLFYNSTTAGFNFDWKNNASGQESYCQTEVLENSFKSSWFYNNPRTSFWLGDISFINNLEPGDSLLYEFKVTCQKTGSDGVYTETHRRTIKSIDPLRGDVDDNGQVNLSDVEILLNQVGLSEDRTYAKSGINLYAACVLNPEPDLASIALIQIWIKNNNDPRVLGLGIGELMSQTQDYYLYSSTEKKSIVLNSSESGLNSISVYPNPFDDRIVVASKKVMDAQLVNMQGQALKQIQLEIGENQISLSDIKSGFCILRTKNAAIKLVKK